MSEHIGADEAQALLDAATRPDEWEAYYTIHGEPFVVLRGLPITDGIAAVATGPDDYGRANAALIAAAPRLAAEVVRLTELLALSEPSDPNEFLPRMQAAIDDPANSGVRDLLVAARDEVHHSWLVKDAVVHDVTKSEQSTRQQCVLWMQEARTIAAERDELRREMDARTDPVLAERLAIVSEWLDAVRHPDMGADVASAASLIGGGE